MEYRIHEKTYILELLGKIPLLIFSLILVIANYLFLAPFILDSGLKKATLLNNTIFVILMIFLVIIVIFTFIRPHYLYKNARFFINDEYIQYKTGWLFYNTAFIPIKNIQQIEIDQGPIQKKYNSSSLEIKTAFDSFITDSLDDELSQLVKDKILNSIKENTRYEN